MEKKGIKRPDEIKKKDNSPTVPELGGKKKNSKEKANPASLTSFSTVPYSENPEIPLNSAYSVIDNDLARDNIENDIPEADLGEI